MGKITINAGSVVFEFELDGHSGPEIRKSADGFVEAFKDFPGFTLGEALPKGKTKDTRPIGTEGKVFDEILATAGIHSVSWLAKHSKYCNAEGFIKRLVREGGLHIGEALYQGKHHMQTMQGVYFKGCAPTPRTCNQDRKALKNWVKDYPGYSAKYVADHCGVVRSRATVALTFLINNGELQITRENGKPVITVKG